MDVKQQLAEKLMPMIQEVNALKAKCWSSIPGMESDPNAFKEIKPLHDKMITLVEETLFIENIFIFPGTYNDYYFCIPHHIGSGKTIIAVDANGLIEDKREYA